MEEKLYFKPEEYGKGTNRRRGKVKLGRKPESEKAKTERSHCIRNLVFFILFLIILIFVILWLLRGKTTITGQYPANIKNESLECTISGRVYEKINKIQPASSEIKITMIFYGEDKFNSASLKYDATFTSDYEAKKAEPIAHAQFSKELASVGLSFGEFNNKFSVIDDKLVLALFATNSDDEDAGLKEFFLIKEDGNPSPTKLTEYKTNYESQGFSCKTSLTK